VSPGDVPDKVADHFKFEAAFNNTTKHVSNCIGPITSDDGARDIVEMAATKVGGKDELRKRPIIVLYGSVASVMDLKTGILPLGAPERPNIQVGVVNLARYYGVPQGVISAGHNPD